MEPSLSVPVRDESTAAAPQTRAGRATGRVAPVRSANDRRMRRLLRLPEGGPRVSVFAAQSAFSRSIAISATRCLLTYVFIPLLGPLLGLTGSVGPILGLVLGAVSMVAIVASTRRFFAADHKWRWGYATIGGAIFVLLAVQAVVDLAGLAS
ncbi:MAG: hypothetical protein GEV08_09125 [Acidimicrobiia bacterium]|nr:hypothetical protein [Acidimicrobiia bacterium]